MNHKRKKCRRSVKCQICTPYRGLGNNKGRVKDKEVAHKKQAKKEITSSLKSDARSEDRD